MIHIEALDRFRAWMCSKGIHKTAVVGYAVFKPEKRCLRCWKRFGRRGAK